MAVVIACALLGCATQSKSSLAPKLGHSQPLPSADGPDDTSPVADPVPREAAPSDSEPDVIASEPTEPAPTETEPEPSEPSIPPPAAVIDTDVELCSHITAVVLSESGNSAGLTAEQVDELIISCSLTLAQDRRQIGEAEYRKRASCVRKASSVKAISACKPE